MSGAGIKKLKCDPWGVVLFRVAFCLACGGAFLHFGSTWTPWHQTPDWYQLAMGLAGVVWGLWHLVAWLASSITVDDAAGTVTLRRLTGDGAEPQVYMREAITAVVLLPRTGFGMGLPPARARRITLHLTSGGMAPVGTISTVWGLHDHAEEIARAIGCGVEDPTDEE